MTFRSLLRIFFPGIYDVLSISWQWQRVRRYGGHPPGPVAAPELFCSGHQVNKNLPKMIDSCHIFPLRSRSLGRVSSGTRKLIMPTWCYRFPPQHSHNSASVRRNLFDFLPKVSCSLTNFVLFIANEEKHCISSKIIFPSFSLQKW